jgi:pteridine reductase
MRPNLAGKAVLVTGGSRRIGAEIARFLHAHGAAIAIHYRSSRTEAESLAASFNEARPASGIALGADLLDIASSGRLVESCIGAFGRLDGLICNASSFFATPIGQITEEHWLDLVGTNLKAPLFLSQAAAIPLRASRGAIVNITDIHADRPLKGFPVYCAAKAGLSGLTRALAAELAPDVRVNAVAPGPILWPHDDTFDAAARAAIVDHTLMKRCGDPMDIAQAVLFFMAESPFVTGQILAIDGGRTAYL